MQIQYKQLSFRGLVNFIFIINSESVGKSLKVIFHDLADNIFWVKVKKIAKIRKQYNQVPHLTKDPIKLTLVYCCTASPGVGPINT